MRHAQRYFAIIGVLLFLFLIYRIGPMAIFSHLREANIAYLFIALLLLVPSVFVRGLRWAIIIRSFGYSYSAFKASLVFLIGMFFSELTPGRAGDAIRALYLKKETSSFGKALSTIFVDRLADILVTTTFALYAVFSLALLETHLSGFIVVAALIFAIPFFLLHEKLVRTILRPFHHRFLPQRARGIVAHTFSEFYRGVHGIRSNGLVFVPILVLTIIGWLITSLQAYFVAKALHLSIPLIFLIGAVPLATLVAVLPITISGLGIREAAYIFLFGSLSIQSSAAVTFSLLFAFIGSWIIALIGAVLWTAMPVNIQSLKEKVN